MSLSSTTQCPRQRVVDQLLDHQFPDPRGTAPVDLPQLIADDVFAQRVELVGPQDVAIGRSTLLPDAVARQDASTGSTRGMDQYRQLSRGRWPAGRTVPTGHGAPGSPDRGAVRRGAGAQRVGHRDLATGGTGG